MIVVGHQKHGFAAYKALHDVFQLLVRPSGHGRCQPGHPDKEAERVPGPRSIRLALLDYLEKIDLTDCGGGSRFTSHRDMIARRNRRSPSRPATIRWRSLDRVTCPLRQPARDKASSGSESPKASSTSTNLNRSLSSSLCLTPNRCSSSITNKSRDL